MTVDEINVLAAKQQPMPDGLCLPEQQLFISLRYLYREYHLKRISKEQAKLEKAKFINSFEKAMFKYRVYEEFNRKADIYAHNSHRIKNTGCEVCKLIESILNGTYKEVIKCEQEEEK